MIIEFAIIIAHNKICVLHFLISSQEKKSEAQQVGMVWVEFMTTLIRVWLTHQRITSVGSHGVPLHTG